MKQRVNLPRRVRWAVPAVAVAVAGGVLAGSAIPAAQAAPLLPSRTPAQLLAALAAKTSAPPLTGTVVETASLGLPALPSAGNPASLPSLLAGAHDQGVVLGPGALPAGRTADHDRERCDQERQQCLAVG